MYQNISFHQLIGLCNYYIAVKYTGEMLSHRHQQQTPVMFYTCLGSMGITTLNRNQAPKFTLVILLKMTETVFKVSLPFNTWAIQPLYSCMNTGVVA
jgi:hypothetical protein